MPKILIVDDSLYIINELKKILIENKFQEIIEATNGKNAYDKYIENKPDLVLLDISMPDWDGLYTLKKILEFDKNAKIIMVTAMENRLVIFEALKNGAIDYIIKPFSDKRIIYAINRALTL
ncbi:MAG TPA: response regulator [bacterium]|nr:response regulator [bacterium]HOL47214.1 response regulator [bacterium]HPQ18277.1 response regulator [bacterium]